MNIFLSAGHNPRAKGASWNGHNEYDEACLWVEETKRFLESGFFVHTVPSESLKNKVLYINEYGSPSDVAIEFHFNSDAGKKSRGSVTLFNNGSVGGQKLATLVQEEYKLRQIFQPDHGIRVGWYQGQVGKPLYFLHKTICPAIILEPEFIYNYATIEENRISGCQAIADAVAKYFYG